MTTLDQKICAYGGYACALLLGVGLMLAGFVPPPSPQMGAQEISDFYAANHVKIATGMIISLFGIAGYVALVAAISAQMQRMQTNSALPQYLQLGAGMIGVLTVMFPVMIFAIAAFRPERDPQITQAINDIGWLILIPAFPTFIAQFAGVAIGVLKDASATPVFPRWVAYFNIWVGILFVPGGMAYLFKTGPLAWDGLLAFWLAASAFFIWLLVMPWVVARAASKAG